MTDAEAAVLGFVKKLATHGLIVTHPDMNFGVVVAYEIPGLLISADDCCENGHGLFTVYATDADDTRISLQVSFLGNQVYVHGAGVSR